VEKIAFGVGLSTLGQVLVARSAKGICAILFGASKAELERDLRRRFPNAAASRSEDRMAGWIAAWIDAPAGGFEWELDIRGTAFQQRVWQELRQIPAGETASYGEIAERVGSPQGSRAVAQACAANALAVAIPCHRVVRESGELGGYRWGVERKQALLQREAL
jgi:AraC family transcriptional regulator of adaptative response/methylated-DNA-[protein]-cysteine methyltransferase